LKTFPGWKNIKNDNKVNQKIVSVDYLKTLHKENSWFAAT